MNSKPVLGKITVINNKNNEVVGIFDSNSETGKYLIVLPEGHYKMQIESDKHQICEQTIDIIELKGFEEVDKKAARENAKKWWENAGQFTPDKSGPAVVSLDPQSYQGFKDYAVLEAGRSRIVLQ